MKHLKKAVALATFVAMIATTTSAHAANGYQQGRRGGSNLAPAIALGTVGVVALIAVLLQNSGSSGHGHSGS